MRAILPAEDWARGSWSFSSQDRGGRDPGMLVVWSTRPNAYPSLHGMPKMEKGAKEAQQRTRPAWYQLATPAREKVAGQFVGKRAGSWASTEVFERYGGRQQRRSKGEGAGMAEEE